LVILRVPPCGGGFLGRRYPQVGAGRQFSTLTGEKSETDRGVDGGDVEVACTALGS
jgi:hypothetical protein